MYLLGLVYLYSRSSLNVVGGFSGRRGGLRAGKFKGYLLILKEAKVVSMPLIISLYIIIKPILTSLTFVILL